MWGFEFDLFLVQTNFEFKIIVGPKSFGSKKCLLRKFGQNRGKLFTLKVGQNRGKLSSTDVAQSRFSWGFEIKIGNPVCSTQFSDKARDYHPLLNPARHHQAWLG